MPPLTWVDWCIVGVIGLSGLIGLIRGLIREVFSLVAWAAAIWVGLHYNREVAAYLETAIPLASVRLTVAFMILFVASLALTGFAGYLLNKLVQNTGLSGTDRFLGLFFGIARGVLVVAVLVLLAGATPLPEDPWWKTSHLIPPFQSFSLWLRDRIPSDYASRIKSPLAAHR